jgi:tRNA dimethylallyltransferase
MINYTKPIIVIAGPTGSGKSSLAIELAKEINGYIINADSRQIYKELMTGTAQPIASKTNGKTWYIGSIKHFLYGQTSIEKPYNVFQYQKDVQRILNSNPDQTPILVGGTGLYIDSIVFNYDLKDTPTDLKYSRNELNSLNVEKLQSLLQKDILNQLNESDRKNPIRLIRAIEKGNSLNKKGKPLNYTYFVLDIPTQELEKRIKDRIEEMINMGLIEENRDLLTQGFNYNMPALRSIGYQEFEGYFENKKTIEQVKEDIFLHTLQYAKRQKTWFKRNKEARYVKPSQTSLKAQLPL